MERIKICEVCGKEVVPKRDKHLNIVNRYYHNECLGKEKTIVKEASPTYSEDQIAQMTFEERLDYLDQRIRNLTSKYDVPEGELREARIILRQLSERYGTAARNLDKTRK